MSPSKTAAAAPDPDDNRAVSANGGITARFAVVTPEAARQYLGQNTHNRHLRQRRIAQLAQDMITGNWDLNGETAKFATDGSLLDGQHRFAAVAESGIAQEMLIVEGLPAPVQETTDIGIKRNFADILQLRGEKDTAILAAVVRRVTIWETGGRTTTGAGNITPTPAMMSATLEKYPGLRDVARMATNVSVHCDMPASHVGLGIWLFAQIDATDTEWFFARLADGQNLSKGNPIYELRRALAESRNVKGRRSESFLTAIMIKAWNAYRAGNSVAYLNYRPGGARPEGFPEPE